MNEQLPLRLNWVPFAIPEMPPPEPCDLRWQVMRWFLFKLPAETAHNLSLLAIRWRLVGLIWPEVRR